MVRCNWVFKHLCNVSYYYYHCSYLIAIYPINYYYFNYYTQIQSKVPNNKKLCWNTMIPIFMVFIFIATHRSFSPPILHYFHDNKYKD